jgi:NADPH-dependent 7-cyano-7-deazaguanine reductase QueF
VLTWSFFRGTEESHENLSEYIVSKLTFEVGKSQIESSITKYLIRACDPAYLRCNILWYGDEDRFPISQQQILELEL